MSLETLLFEQKQVKVIDASIDYHHYVFVDLSAENTTALKINLTDARLFENYIEDYLKFNLSKVAFGGYLEKRNLYKRSEVFNLSHLPERNIHLGLDLWIKADTNVLAALDGTIHSFQDNSALGDYGPTIILEHQLFGYKFYTLYGHLSLESLNDLTIGQAFKGGETLAQLGAAPINGDYAPHLHFQIIKDLQGKQGDYPGVCAAADLDFYKQNFPDPNLLLKIK